MCAKHEVKVVKQKLRVLYWLFANFLPNPCLLLTIVWSIVCSPQWVVNYNTHTISTTCWPTAHGIRHHWDSTAMTRKHEVFGCVSNRSIDAKEHDSSISIANNAYPIFQSCKNLSTEFKRPPYVNELTLFAMFREQRSYLVVEIYMLI